MTPRRWSVAAAAAVLVVALVGGRWLAIETAERAWAATFTGGAVLTDARALARLLQGLIVLVSIAWSTGNILWVYRAIGSVQMPRRLGDLEIVEAVPQRVLLGVALLTGVVGGVILSWNTGDWWLAAVLASAPPHLGATDPILHQDLGYYLGVLPWHSTLQSYALALAAGAATVVALLYAGIGSLRLERQRVHASEHARPHLAFLLTCLALVMAWGAQLDSAEVVAGLHGPVDQALLDVRLPGAPVVAAVAIATALATLLWGWRGSGRSSLLLGSWSALLLVATGTYLVGPALLRAAGGAGAPRLAEERDRLERQAFGLTPLDDGAPPAYASPASGAARIPLWNAERVASVTGVPAGAVTLWPAASPTWLVAPAGERGAPRIAVETDTGLVLRTAPTADTVAWFAPGLGEFAAASPDSWPTLRAAGVPLAGRWRRAALAWTLQAPELARAETDGLVLLWRRDIAARLARLAPFATFGTPVPAIADGALWWLSWGYVTGEGFPLVRAQAWEDRDVRYARAGLVGAVRAATGETHVWLAPGYDSLAAAWARHFAPLIEPLETLPAPLRAALPYPAELFRLAAGQLLRSGDSVWTVRPHTPFELVVGETRWTATGVEGGATRRFEGLLAGAVTADGPRLWFWRAAAPARLPPDLVGSTETSPGQLRIWPVRVGEGGAAEGAAVVLTAQAQFFQRAGLTPAPAPPPRFAQVYLSLGARTGEGGTAPAALRALLAGGGRLALADTSIGARWARARELAQQADSALARGDLERFTRLYRELARLLAPPPRRR